MLLDLEDQEVFDLLLALGKIAKGGRLSKETRLLARRSAEGIQKASEELRALRALGAPYRAPTSTSLPGPGEPRHTPRAPTNPRTFFVWSLALSLILLDVVLYALLS